MSQILQPGLIRPMEVADLPAGHVLSAAFDWPHRLEDWALMLRLGEGVVAERDGTVAGTAMAWRYGTDAATVGMIIVAEKLHGQGTGRRLLTSLLDRLDGRTVRLNATKEGLKLYRDLGFRPGRAVTSHRSERLLACPAPTDPPRRLDQTDLAWIATLDRQACGMDRKPLLAALLDAGHGVGSDDIGFALSRRFGRGHLIGPVVASDEKAARRLIDALLAPLVGQLVRIDITEHDSLAAWLADRGLVASEAVLGMTLGPQLPHADRSTTFAVASQAYG